MPLQLFLTTTKDLRAIRVPLRVNGVVWPVLWYVLLPSSHVSQGLFARICRRLKVHARCTCTHPINILLSRTCELPTIDTQHPIGLSIAETGAHLTPLLCKAHAWYYPPPDLCTFWRGVLRV